MKNIHFFPTKLESLICEKHSDVKILPIVPDVTNVQCILHFNYFHYFSNKMNFCFSYPGVSVRNFTTSWRDGLAFSALLNKHRDDISYPREHPREKEEMDKCLAKAFKEAEQKLGIQRLLDPEDVNVEYPDEKSIITYVVTLYHYFSKARDETVCSKRIKKVPFYYCLCFK